MLYLCRNIRILVNFVWYDLMEGTIFCEFAVRNDTKCQCKCCTQAKVPTKEVPTRTTLEPMQASWI